MKIVRYAMVLVIILSIIAVGFSKKNWDEQIEQHSQKAQTLNETQEGGRETEQMETTEQTQGQESRAFYQQLANQQISTIKLLGDGITTGVGLQAYGVPDGGRIIFNGNGEIYREAGYEFTSWANQLRNYVSASKFGNVDLINAGIRDKTAAWALKYVNTLLNSKEDVIFVMIGTDDRIDYTLAEYEATMRKLLAIADERSNLLVVMSPPPSKEDIAPYNFSMEEIDAVLKKISKEKGYPFISHYDAFQEHLAENAAVSYEDLMQTAGANPVEGGYAVMWETIREELGLK